MSKIYFDTVKNERNAAYAVRRGGNIAVKIGHGKYKGSVGLIENKYLYTSGDQIYLNSTTSFIIKLGPDLRVMRYKMGSECYYYMRGINPNSRLKLVGDVTTIVPQTIKDRHGVELNVGDPVLIAHMKNFSFGMLEKITPSAIILRKGQQRTRVPHKECSVRGVVKLDRDLVSRFMMEKLAKL